MGHPGVIAVPVAALSGLATAGGLIDVQHSNPAAAVATAVVSAAVGWGLRPGGWCRRVWMWVWSTLHREGREELAGAVFDTDAARDAMSAHMAGELAPLLGSMESELVELRRLVEGGLRAVDAKLAAHDEVDRVRWAMVQESITRRFDV